MKGLFLDDERNPENVTWVGYYDDIEWTIVRNGKEWSGEMKNASYYDVFSLDHDLQDFTEIDEALNLSSLSSAFGTIVVNTNKFKTVEFTGADAAKTLLNLTKEKEIFVHTANPVGSENIRNILRNSIHKVY